MSHRDVHCDKNLDTMKSLLVGVSTLSWWGGLSTSVTLRAIPAVAYLLAEPPLLDRSKSRRQTKRDTETDRSNNKTRKKT